MRPIAEYDIAEGRTVHELREAVRAMIGKGWQPIGGPSAVYADSWTFPVYMQAVVKPRECEWCYGVGGDGEPCQGCGVQCQEEEPRA